MPPEPTPTKTQKLQIRKWDLSLVKAGAVLPILQDLMVELPVPHDEARDAAKARALLLVRGAKKVRGVSALVGGGFVVNVELA